MRWNYWAIIGLAVWLIVSPWILGFSGFNLPLWNSVFIGSFIIIFMFWNKPPVQ